MPCLTFAKRILLAAFFLPLSIAPAAAFVDPPTFSPAQPYAGQPIEMSVRAGHCHGFTPEAAGSPPFVEVQVNGNVIDVIILGSESSSSMFCNIQPHTVTVNIGRFQEGGL